MKIDFTVPHSLNQHIALQRIVTGLQSQMDKKPGGIIPVEIKAADFRINFDEFTVQVTLRISSLAKVTNTPTFKVGPNEVHVTSDEADETGEALVMRIEESRLKSLVMEWVAA